MTDRSVEIESSSVDAAFREALLKIDRREDRVRAIAQAYAAAFPDASLGALEAHLALVGLGSEFGIRLDNEIARAGFDVTRPRVTLLRLLYLTEGRQLYLTEIAREMEVSAAAVSQLVDLLERDGWVERVVSPADRRVIFARLTPAGEERCGRLIPLVADFMMKSVSALSDREVEQLLSLLSKLMRHMDAARA